MKKSDTSAEPESFLFAPGDTIDLSKINTDSLLGFASEEAAHEALERDAGLLMKYQDRLMAHETYGLVVLFQGMDASGKDEAILHVLSHLNPGGCEFKQFRTMTPKEEKHDYLQRAALALPARGQIAIFNRSYYENVTAERVHPEKVEAQGLPAEVKKDLWAKRFRQINNFEQYLTENGIHLLKFFLHVSKREQRKRLLERIDLPEQQWQFSTRDVTDREHWKKYRTVYSEALTRTNTPEARWHVIPSDQSWCTRAVVARVLREKLQSLHSGYPRLGDEEREEMESARKTLESDTSDS